MKNKKMVLWIALILTAMLLLGCSKKAGAQETKGSSAAGSARTGAYNSESDFQIDWDTNVSGGVIITKYIGTKNEVNIPPSIQNSPVTRIGGKAFWGYDERSGTWSQYRNITSITIPNSVTSIGNSAFQYTSLINVTIPDSVTSIEQTVFANCDKLTSVTIGNSVTSIEGTVFAVCTSLTSVIIGNSVTSIGYQAFYNCNSLASITIPNNVTWIGQEAFAKCTSLTSITIPDSVTGISSDAFRGCDNLTSVTFQGKNTSYDFEAFPGDLRAKYLASDGGSGTYKRFANGGTWKKQ